MIIYRVKYSYLCGSPNSLHRISRTSNWFISIARMKECAFWGMSKNPKREFQYEIETAHLNMDIG